MTDTGIRDAEPDDIPEIIRVTKRAWAAAYDDILSETSIEKTINELREGEVTRRLIDRDDLPYFVAEQASAVVGYISGAPTDEANVMRLGALYVDPDRWNEGIGSALLNEFETVCEELEVEAIQFEVLSENEIGMAFYRTHGYPVVAERETDRFEEPATVSVFREEIS